MAAVAVDLEAFIDVAPEGIGAHVGKKPRRHPGLFIGGDGVGDHGQAGKVRVGDQKWAA